MKVVPEFLTIFLNLGFAPELTNTEFSQTFGVNLKNLNDLKLIFLELAHLGLHSGKVWENRFFSILHDLS